jgi:hypothetical protein
VALSADVTGPRDDAREIVIVIGPGRSGTSTVAGALCHCGLEVPGRAIRGNATNPAGFYEPRWVVDFHRRILDETHVSSFDTMPDAQERVAAAAAKPVVRDTLRTWLGERLLDQPRLVVKDPRIVWFRDLWVDVASELGAEPGFVTMVRHPAEVAASRQKAYDPDGPELRDNEIRRIAGWINVTLTAERASSGSPRVFVKYTDLVADWRSALSRIERDLGLRLEPAIGAAEHPVDGFIDSSLRRVNVDWSAVAVPQHLRDLGERVWQVMSELAGKEDTDERRAEVDRLREEYLEVTTDALALVRPAIRRQTSTARRRARRQLREKQAQESRTAEGASSGLGAAWRRLTGGKA